MPSVEPNSSLWNQHFDWSHGGDEWSACWGGPEAQWFGAILPRIHALHQHHSPEFDDKAKPVTVERNDYIQRRFTLTQRVQKIGGLSAR
jgi:hypothetical protein